MSDSSLSIVKQAKITRLILNRPDKCNALNGTLVACLQDAFRVAREDKQTGLVVLSGAGNHFCAGADIAWMQELAQGSLKEGRDDAEQLASLFYQMYTFPKPILTVAQGSTMGGGLGFLACSDIIIAAADASFCFSEIKIGLVPAVISPYVIAMIGEQAARYYFLTAERFAAPEALRIGLVQKLVPPEALIKTGLTIAQTILQHSPAAIAETKRLLPWVSRQDILPALSKKTAAILAKMRLSQQGQEGLNAFLEKRSPVWDDPV